MLDQFTQDIALLIERGGYIMVPLLALSVISIMLIIERCWFWMLTHRPSQIRRMARLNDALRRGDERVVKALIDGDRNLYSQLARRLLEGNATEAVAVEAVETQRPRVDRFMTALSTIITAAPLIGILGTVIGIIQSFRLLGDQSVLTEPSEVAGGIAQALLTTALGLIVAIVTLFPYMAFKGQADRAMGRMESVIAAAQQGAGINAQRLHRVAPGALGGAGRAGATEIAASSSPPVAATKA